MASKPSRPEKELKLDSLDEPLVMTYVMFNDILRFVGTVEEAMVSIMSSQETRNLIIRRLLTDTKKQIDKEEDLIPVEDIDLDIFEIEDVLGWTLEHVTYFFMQTASQIQTRMQKFPGMEKMSSDLSGSGTTDSTTKSKSAGPTESDQEDTKN